MIETRGSRGNIGYAAFRTALLEGRLQPGAVMTQAELCNVLDMSLSPLRESLALLESDGLVQIRRRAGITIVAPDVNFIRTNFQFRTLIERDAIAKFAESVPRAWVQASAERHQTALTHVNGHDDLSSLEQKLRDIDWEFHSTIVAASRNDMISETHFRLQENLRLARVLNEDYASPSKVAEAINEHLVVLDRLKAHDAAGAASALESHFRAAIHRAFAG